MPDLVFVEEHPLAGRLVALADGATIGREGCDVLLADPEASRRHAMLHVDARGASIEDLGSKNGTFINEQPVEGHVRVQAGDVVRFGNTIWRLGRQRVGANETTVTELRR